MPECEYCGATHDSEDAHLDHLESEHYDELGPIDKRRVDENTGPTENIPVGPIAVGVVLLAATVVVGYVVFVAGGNDGSSVGPQGSDHYHGQMEMVITGDRVDFSRSKYQLRDDRFHFESGNGQQWHAHATGVTFEYAMNALGFRVSTGPSELETADQTYTDGEGYEVIFEVNGDGISSTDYVLKPDDSIRVVVQEA